VLRAGTDADRRAAARRCRRYARASRQRGCDRLGRGAAGRGQPAGASLQGQELEALRRGTAHAGLVLVTQSRHGSKFVSLIGANRLFHAPEDRWPDAVDLPAAARLAAVAARLAVEAAT